MHCFYRRRTNWSISRLLSTGPRSFLWRNDRNIVLRDAGFSVVKSADDRTQTTGAELKPARLSFLNFPVRKAFFHRMESRGLPGRAISIRPSTPGFLHDRLSLDCGTSIQPPVYSVDCLTAGLPTAPLLLQRTRIRQPRPTRRTRSVRLIDIRPKKNNTAE